MAKPTAAAETASNRSASRAITSERRPARRNVVIFEAPGRAE
jgi:hypothetical protein